MTLRARSLERLPATARDDLAIMDKLAKLSFYRVIQIPIKVRDVKLGEIFIVSQIGEDAIFGMPFQANHDCRMDFPEPVVTIGEWELVCTD